MINTVTEIAKETYEHEIKGTPFTREHRLLILKPLWHDLPHHKRQERTEDVLSIRTTPIPQAVFLKNKKQVLQVLQNVAQQLRSRTMSTRTAREYARIFGVLSIDATTTENLASDLEWTANRITL